MLQAQGREDKPAQPLPTSHGWPVRLSCLARGGIVCVRPPVGLAGHWESKGSCATHFGGWLWALKPTLPCQADRTLQWLWTPSERFGVNGVEDARDFHSCIATVATQGPAHSKGPSAFTPSSCHGQQEKWRKESKDRALETFLLCGPLPCLQPACWYLLPYYPLAQLQLGHRALRCGQGARMCTYLLTKAELGCTEQVKLHENDRDSVAN